MPPSFGGAGGGRLPEQSRISSSTYETGRLEGLPVFMVIVFCAGRLEGSAPTRGFLLDSHKHWIVVGGEAALVAAEGDLLWGI